jgi:hypothetical protein
MHLRSRCLSLLHAVMVAFALLCAAGAGRAAASPLNLVTDGTFQATSLSSPGGYICKNGSGVGSTCTSNLTDWSSSCGRYGCTGSNTPSSLLFAGATNVDFSAWNGGYGLASSLVNPPMGGNVVAIDGDVNYATSIFQTITGLKVGDSYVLTFQQAAAQQLYLSGATTEQWQVTLGTKTDTSTLMHNASQSVVGWNSQSMFFIATSTSEVLTFMALGTPTNEPPVVLLADVALTEIPEPTDAAMLAAGVLGLIMMRRRAGSPG